VEPPSSDPVEPAEDLDIFPLIGDYFKALDNGPYGKDGDNFSAYTVNFTTNQYVRICDLEGLTGTYIPHICPSMPSGTATKVAKYVKLEIAYLRKQAKRGHASRDVRY
jgi:hypothetical protein